MKPGRTQRTIPSFWRRVLLVSGFSLFGAGVGNCNDRATGLIVNGFHSGDVYSVVGEGFETLTALAIQSFLSPLQPPADGQGGGIPAPTL